MKVAVRKQQSGIERVFITNFEGLIKRTLIKNSTRRLKKKFGKFLDHFIVLNWDKISLGKKGRHTRQGRKTFAMRKKAFTHYKDQKPKFSLFLP